MSEEKKDIEREEDNLDSDEEDTTVIPSAGYTAERSSSNHSINTLELDSKENFINYVANGLEVRASDIMIIEELSEVMGHEQNSNGKEIKVIYEYPSDLDEEASNQVPQAYFDNTEHCLEKEVLNFDFDSLSQNYTKEDSVITMDKETGGEINEVPKERKFIDSTSNKPQIKNPCTQIFTFEKNEKSSQTDRKNLSLKYVDYSSDEFADIEDNVKDSSSDNNESYCGLQTIPAMKFPTELLPSRTKPGQKNETGKENHMSNKFELFSSSTSQTEENTSEVKKIHFAKNINAEASCSYSPSNSSKLLKSFSISIVPEGDKKGKCSLPTIVEESESENKMNILKDNQPPRSKVNPLKMKAKVGNRKDKCNVCRVRLGLCAIKCRCGGYYCAKHRYDKEHNCPFDYKTMGAEEIRRNNPKVIAEKIRKL